MQEKTKIGVFVVTGLTLAVAGAIFAGCFQLIFDHIISEVLVIDEDAEIFDTWKNPDSVDIYLQLMVFNVTNPEEVAQGGKPNLTEHGPYTYEERFFKNNITFDDAEGTVTYQDKTTYFFKRELSVGDESDVITTLNTLFVLLGGTFYNNNRLLEILYRNLEPQGSLFEEYTIGELFMYGWDLPLIRNKTIYDFLNDLDIPPPDYLKNNRFGFFYQTNGTYGPYITVKTGETDIDEYLFIQKFGNQTELGYWDDQYCDMINGSDGTQFPPQVEKSDVLYIFIAELCRSLYLTYEKTFDLYDKLETYRFIPPESMLGDPNTVAENFCYCTKVYPEDDGCPGAGMINLGGCVNIPIVMSTPHFYQGDEDEIAKLIGIKPDKDLHQTILDVEPVSGVVMSAHKRIQLNLPLRQYGKLAPFENVPDVIVPIFWIDETATISEDDATDIDTIYTVTFIVIYTICAILIAVGIGLVIAGAYRWRRPSEDIIHVHKKSLTDHDSLSTKDFISAEL